MPHGAAMCKRRHVAPPRAALVHMAGLTPHNWKDVSHTEGHPGEGVASHGDISAAQPFTHREDSAWHGRISIHAATADGELAGCWTSRLLQSTCTNYSCQALP